MAVTVQGLASHHEPLLLVAVWQARLLLAHEVREVGLARGRLRHHLLAGDLDDLLGQLKLVRIGASIQTSIQTSIQIYVDGYVVVYCLERLLLRLLLALHWRGLRTRNQLYLDVLEILNNIVWVTRLRLRSLPDVRRRAVRVLGHGHLL